MSDLTRWATSTATVWGSMTTTTNLDDGSAGDTSTGESASTTASGSSSTCSNVAARVVFVAQRWFGGPQQSLTAATAKITLTRSAGLDACTTDPANPLPTVNDAGTASLQVWDGTTWSEVSLTSLTLPTLDGVGEVNSLSASFPAQSTCWARLVVTYVPNAVRGTGSIVATVRVSDWRITKSATGATCSEGTNGGTGPATDTGGGGGGGGGSSCTCDSWVERTPLSDAATERAALSDASTERVPITTSWTKRTCA